jgi:hypothetical protein
MELETSDEIKVKFTVITVILNHHVAQNSSTQCRFDSHFPNVIVYSQHFFKIWFLIRTVNI